jgi:hypothetical protein
MKKILLAGLLLGGLSSCSSSQHLDNTSWLASAALATVLSTGITSLINWLTKDKEYKNDYYKRVIDKRIKAVEALESYIGLFNIGRKARHSTSEDEFTFHFIFSDENCGKQLSDAIENVSKNGIWYGVETAKHANKLSKLVGEAYTKFDNKNEQEIIKIAIEYYREIEGAKIEVQRSISNDMASLQKVEEFFRAKKLAAQQKSIEASIDEYI